MTRLSKSSPAWPHNASPHTECGSTVRVATPFSPDCFTSANKQQRVSSSAQKPGRSTSSLPSRYGSFTQAAHTRQVLRPYRGSHRSEEHTSELQSRGHLVCRLLLEKKHRACNGSN